MRAPAPAPAVRAALVAIVLLVSAACSSTGPKATPIEETDFADTLHIDLARFTRLPSGMYVRDSIVGTGNTLTRNRSVTVSYVGSLANGYVFDRSNSTRPSITFVLGSGQVIPGWDIGLEGMKVGGKRHLIIPPELAYGSRDNGPIPAYSVLVFTVDALAAAQ
jgi:FKBP-type peptidyl-prolyl cis-trans isomerase